MARKHFGDLIARAPIEIAETDESSRPVSMRAPKSLGDELMHIQSSSVRELDPQSISASALKDRLSIDDDSIDALAESIREHGQHVPIMVRPRPGEMDRYEIIYGRRRLEAIRRLGDGYLVKALIRTLENEQAIIAQGQENNIRVNPSFIEKALFAQSLERMGYGRPVILQALDTDKVTLSRMLSTAEAIPEAVIAAIGPAHDVGRRRWMELADYAKLDRSRFTETCLAILRGENAKLASHERIDVAIAAVKSAMEVPEIPTDCDTGDEGKPPSMEPVKETDSHSSLGSSVTAHTPPPPGQLQIDRSEQTQRKKPNAAPGFELSVSPQKLQLIVKRKDNPAFHEWLEKNIDLITKDIHKRWIDDSMG